MNILIVNYEYPPLGGGGGVATKDLAEELAKRHTVHVITSGYTNLPSEETLHGVHIHRVSVYGRTKLPTATVLSMLTFTPTAIWRGLKLCREIDFTVVNGQFVLPSGLPALFLAKYFRIPFVLSLIGGDLYDPSKSISPHRHGILRATIRAIAARAQAITAISYDTKKRAERLHGIRQPITVTHLGLVPRRAAASSRGALHLPDGILGVSVGRLIPRKGYETLLAAWKSVPDAKLVIIGDGFLRKRLEKLIAAYNLENRVWLVGSVSDEEKIQMLQQSDFFVSSATHEGFGIVFLEAMDSGLPIIAPNEGGQTDFLEHEHHALLVDSSRPEVIAQTVNRIVNDASLRQSMSKRNKEDVRNFYIDRTAALFERVLQNAIQKYAERRN